MKDSRKLRRTSKGEHRALRVPSIECLKDSPPTPLHEYCSQDEGTQRADTFILRFRQALNSASSERKLPQPRTLVGHDFLPRLPSWHVQVERFASDAFFRVPNDIHHTIRSLALNVYRKSGVTTQIRTLSPARRTD